MVDLHRVGDHWRTLGLLVSPDDDPRYLIVDDIWEPSLVSEWNAKSPEDQRIKPGDIILAVNGASVSGEEMLAKIQVKNTFIHYGTEQEDEQPAYRPSKSGPAVHIGHLRSFEMDEAAAAADGSLGMSANTTGFARADPAIVPMPVMPEEPPSPASRAALAPSPARAPPSTMLAPAPMLAASSLPEAKCSRSQREVPAVAVKNTVKNTFIHYDDDDDEQPDYQPAKSGPALLVGTAYSASVPAWVPLPASVPSPRVLPSTTPPSQRAAPPAAAPSGAAFVPSESVGSASHAAGTCKACAHNWKPGSCCKGYDCTFCHMCTEEDFKRRRREKLNRLKAEKDRRRREGEGEELGEGTSGSAASPALSSSSPGPQQADTKPRTLESEGLGLDRAQFGGELVVGELTTSSSSEGARIVWAVEMRKLRGSSQGLSRRLSVQLGDVEVPFLILVGPASEEAACASRGISLQLKCMYAGALAEKRLRCGVRFAVGWHAEYRLASESHDFAASSVCSLPPKDCIWLLDPSEPRCILRIEVWPVIR